MRIYRVRGFLNMLNMNTIADLPAKFNLNEVIMWEKRSGCFFSSGITMGSALAMILSWERSHSILWAILHGILSWLYVIYYAITRGAPAGV